MPYNVPDDRLRDQHRAVKSPGHAKGGNSTWRTYETTKAMKAARAKELPAESWWLGLTREAFTTALAQRTYPDSPIGPHWHHIGRE